MSNPLPQSRLRVQRIADAAVERARLTVVPRRRTTAPRVPFVMLVTALLLAGVVGLLMFNTSMQQHAFTASALETTASQLRADEQALRSELEALSAGQRVAEQAQRMGMTRQGAPAFLRLERDGAQVVGDPTLPVGLDFDARLPKAQKPRSLIPDRKVVRVKPERAPDRTRRQARPEGTGDTQRGTAALGQ